MSAPDFDSWPENWAGLWTFHTLHTGDIEAGCRAAGVSLHDLIVARRHSPEVDRLWRDLDLALDIRITGALRARAASGDLRSQGLYLAKVRPLLFPEQYAKARRDDPADDRDRDEPPVTMSPDEADRVIREFLGDGAMIPPAQRAAINLDPNEPSDLDGFDPLAPSYPAGRSAMIHGAHGVPSPHVPMNQGPQSRWTP